MLIIQPRTKRHASSLSSPHAAPQEAANLIPATALAREDFFSKEQNPAAGAEELAQELATAWGACVSPGSEPKAGAMRLDFSKSRLIFRDSGEKKNNRASSNCILTEYHMEPTR